MVFKIFLREYVVMCCGRGWGIFTKILGVVFTEGKIVSLVAGVLKVCKCSLVLS